MSGGQIGRIKRPNSRRRDRHLPKRPVARGHKEDEAQCYQEQHTQHDKRDHGEFGNQEEQQHNQQEQRNITWLEAGLPRRMSLRQARLHPAQGGFGALLSRESAGRKCRCAVAPGRSWAPRICRGSNRPGREGGSRRRGRGRGRQTGGGRIGCRYRRRGLGRWSGSMAEIVSRAAALTTGQQPEQQ